MLRTHVHAWRTREVPEQWKHATIRVLHRKQCRSDFNNCRGTSFVTHAVKVLFNAVAPRLTNYYVAGGTLPEEQGEAYPVPSTVDMALVVR